MARLLADVFEELDIQLDALGRVVEDTSLGEADIAAALAHESTDESHLLGDGNRVLRGLGSSNDAEHVRQPHVGA